MKVLLVIAASLAVASAGVVDPSFKAKVKAGELTEGILELPQVQSLSVDNNTPLSILRDDARVDAMIANLKSLTQAAQAPFVATISKLGLQSEQYWINNIVHIKGLTYETLSTLAAIKGEFILREQNYASINPAIGAVEANITQNPQWGVAMIRAPEAWAVTQGANSVVGVIDTGCNQGHVALSSNYANQWDDPYYNLPGPTDQHGHGSHCTGTICGTQNGIGVAPAARWICCRGLNHQGSGTETQLNRCAQFMTSANPRPHAVSNSWGGGQGSTWYNPSVTAWRNAGIVPVFAQGNSGSACRTANSPGDQPNLIGVGATTNTDAMATFSSRGMSVGGLRKPEVSAPGQNIVSAGTGANNYATMSGTSMACPHVAGAVALILSAHPNHSYDQVLGLLADHAAHPTLTAADRNCGLPTPGQDFPNNAFGDGRIDVGRSLGV